MKKRILSLFMTIMMCLSVLPVGVAAAAKYPITGRTTKEMSIYKAAKVNKNVTLKKLPRNSKVKIVKKVNSDFYQVEYGKYKGYIQRKYTLEVRPYSSGSKNPSPGVVTEEGCVYYERVATDGGKSTQIPKVTLPKGTPITQYQTEQTGQGKVIKPISYTLQSGKVGFGFLLSTVASASSLDFTGQYKANKDIKVYCKQDHSIYEATKEVKVYGTKKVKKKEVVDTKKVISPLKAGEYVIITSKKIGDYRQVSLTNEKHYRQKGYVHKNAISNNATIKKNSKVFTISKELNGFYVSAFKVSKNKFRIAVVKPVTPNFSVIK